MNKGCHSPTSQTRKQLTRWLYATSINAFTVADVALVLQVQPQRRDADDVPGTLGKLPLFMTYKGRAWTSHHLTDMINDLIQRAKLPGTAYCCRHTACSHLIFLAKGDLALVQSITGHRTLSELQRYLHATNDRRKTIADAYNSATEQTQPQTPSYIRLVH